MVPIFKRNRPDVAGHRIIVPSEPNDFVRGDEIGFGGASGADFRVFKV